MADTDVVEDEVATAEPETAESPEVRARRSRGLAPGLADLDRRWLGWGAGVLVLALLVVSFFAADINPISVLTIGVQVGSVFSLIALGVVLVYKATRVLNFAQGELGTASAFLAFALMVSLDWESIGATPDRSDFWWTALAAIAAGVVLAILINVLVVQRLADASPITALVATVGVSLLFVSVEVVMFEAQPRPFPRPVGGTAFELANVAVSWHTVIVLVVLLGAAMLLAILFRTPPGIALLATAQEPFAAELSGVSVRAMSTLAWGAAGLLGALGGLLGAGVFTNLTPGFVTTQFLIPALVGAVLGGLTSMVGAVVGGILVGLATTYSNELVLGMGWDVAGPPQIATLTVLIAVLLFRPRGLFGREA